MAVGDDIGADICGANRVVDTCGANRVMDICGANRVVDICGANRVNANAGDKTYSPLTPHYPSLSFPSSFS